MRPVYVSDTHFNHANIIRFCQRPFTSVEQMNESLLTELVAAARTGHPIVHGGDVGFRLASVAKTLPNFSAHILVAGNHDIDLRQDRPTIKNWFGRVVGTQTEWRTNMLVLQDVDDTGARVSILVSHLPQRDLHGCAYNVYGHFHNNLLQVPANDLDKDWLWVLQSPAHLNASVEITGYRPLTFPELKQANRTALEQYETAKRLWEQK